MKTTKTPYHELIANKLIEQLAAGTAPWQKPWEPGSLSLPHNPVSGSRYKGINVMWLEMQGFADPRWMTYRQAASIDAQVKKGEKSTRIEYWKFYDTITEKDASGKPKKGADGKNITKSIKLKMPRVFSANVFNATQIDGLPELVIKTPQWDRHQRIERLLTASNAVIQHDQGDRAFYSPILDEIHLPSREQFDTADNYYATNLHELGHWTGHPSRLDRDLTGFFGSDRYAKEELRAEISSLMMGDEFEIGHDPSQHASYVKSWIRVLQDDPKEILRAARDAEKIRDFILEFETQVKQKAA